MILSEDRENFEKMSKRMGEKGLRPILLAYTQVDVENHYPKIQSVFKQ